MKVIHVVVVAWALAALPALATLEQGLRLLHGGDAPEAYEVLRKAAFGGDARAAREIGGMLDRDLPLPGGRLLVAKPETAAGWYLKAFEGGDKESANALGLMFYQGRGVPRDIGESLAWFRRAGRDVDGLTNAYGKVAAADRPETVAWWLSFRTQVLREVEYPREPLRQNTSGVVYLVIDARMGVPEFIRQRDGGTGELLRTDMRRALREAALEVGESVLRQFPPPRGAVDANLRMPLDFMFKIAPDGRAVQGGVSIR